MSPLTRWPMTATAFYDEGGNWQREISPSSPSPFPPTPTCTVTCRYSLHKPLTEKNVTRRWQKIELISILLSSTHFRRVESYITRQQLKVQLKFVFYYKRCLKTPLNTNFERGALINEWVRSPIWRVDDRLTLLWTEHFLGWGCVHACNVCICVCSTYGVFRNK